jgi:membrane-associated phospholipid phosphatase
MAAEAVVSAVVAASACRSFPAADLLICLAKEEESIWSLSLASLLLIPYSWIPYLALSLAGLYFLTYRTSFAMLVGIFIVGLGILNEGLLKNVIKQPRPEGTCACGFGMPSGHAAITTGLLVWLTLELLLNNWSPPFIARWNTRGKLLLLGILVLLLLPTSYSRV